MLVATVAWFVGCASNKAGEVKAGGAKRITGITTDVTADSVIVTINGNQPLTYTAIKQVFPMGVLFHFPETSLATDQTVTTPPPNEIIGSVKASELVEDKSTTSRIFIAMKTDAPYDLNPQDSGLQVLFPKAAAGAAAPPAPVAKKPAAAVKTEPLPAKKEDLPAASHLKTVTATPLKNNVVVDVKADGAIKDYKSFTIDGKQPRIVIDMFKIKSPFKQEQRLAVKSPWVNQVRHFGYPDKVRLVLDTPKASLAKYSASPTANGLVIHIGNVPQPAPESTAAPVGTEKEKVMVAQKPSQPAAAEKQAPKATAAETPAAVSAKTAWVNRIDFSSEEAGKSSLIIGTTVPVKYDLEKVGAKRLQLKLFNTNLPDYRKRALITTRFESAVDRVTPIQTAEMKDDSLITIELREAVAYNIKQEDNTLRINFAASSIPPKPYEDADLPEWKKVLAEAPAASAKEVETGKAPSAQAPEKKAAEKSPVEKAAEAQTLEERLAAQTAEKKYTGEKIAFDFYDTDIRNVFRLLREISGKSFAIDKNVTGRITLNFEKPVPWDQALDLVLKMNQLGMVMEGDVIRIATLSTLAQEEKLKQAQLKASQQAQQQAVALEPLYTEYIPISYSNASTEVLPHVQAILTESRGKANVDTRNNQIIITDTAEKIQQAKQIVEKIDMVTPQVIIETRIVEANSNFTREIGVNLAATLGTFDVPYTSSWKAGPTTFATDTISEDLLPTGVFTASLSKISGTNFNIDAVLAAAEVDGKTNIISAPKIVTLDNKKARIKQGFEVPYIERDSSGEETVKFRDIDLLLEVTPTVTPDNRISMLILVTKNDIYRETDLGPALSTNETNTEIIVDDSSTIVIGGIIKSTINWSERGVPGLRSIGILGWLFKNQKESDDKNELLIFLTPRIVQLEQKRLS